MRSLHQSNTPSSFSPKGLLSLLLNDHFNSLSFYSLIIKDINIASYTYPRGTFRKSCLKDREDVKTKTFQGHKDYENLGRPVKTVRPP